MDFVDEALLRLHLTPGLGRTTLFRLHDVFGDFSSALSAPAQHWQDAGIAGKLQEQIPAANNPEFRQMLRKLDALQVRLMHFWDPSYPEPLRDIHDPPAILYLRGTMPQQDCFAIVGSRRASISGRTSTREIARDLAEHGICIVSGLARGIDSAAHQGALDAKGATVAVLGCGIDCIYPPENSRLFLQILDNNAILSEFPPGTPPLAGHFPGRNRIISGLSRGVLIVEAAEGSGSLITGDFALEQGRELFAVPGDPYKPNSRGTNQLLKEGANLVTETSDILQVLWPGQPTREQRSRLEDFAAQLDDRTLSVYRELNQTPRHLDEISRKCGLTPMELSAILLDLELRGGIQALPGSLYIRGRL